MAFDFSEDHIKQLAMKFGIKNVNAQIEELRKTRPFIESLRTTVGKELIYDWMEDWSTLFGRIVNDAATPEEKMAFIIIDKKLNEAAKKIAKYYQMKTGLDDAFNSIQG